MFIVLAVTLVLYLLWRWYLNGILCGLKSLRGPASYPFIGSLMTCYPVSTLMTRLGDMCNIYGKTYKMTIPWTAGIVTIDLDLVEYILTSQATINKSILYIFLKEWLGDGLLLSKSAKWRLRRKTITPTFHFKVLDQFVQVFNKNNQILVQQLQKSIDKQDGAGVVNIAHYVTLAAMDNIVETAMGTSMNSQLNDQSDYVWATKFMTANIYDHIVNPITYLKATYIFTPAYWKERKALKILKEYTMSLIKSRREALSKENKSTLINNNADVETYINDEDFGIKKKTAFLDLLLQTTIDGKPLSDEDIMEEVDTFMFEGHDTVSAAISFTLFCIAQHPDIQSKVIEEQRSIFANEPDRNITSEDLKNMTYLEMVIKEGLRFYPSVPSIARNVSEDFHYKDIHVRKGTTIAIPILTIHKDPSNFPNPEKFIPERFLPAEQSKRHAFAFLPFSAGHRNCIGQRFAMMEMKATISKVCRHFELGMTNPPHECILPSAVVLMSKNGVNLTIKTRKW
ncbi:probable cytochrome P450 4d14 [Atheta coriaria]|uniref:probable cytochrome P450 4d14 n=1 Tax=Dalotia coriaria TaxID=877792 RepID=UPI0031F36D8F